MDNFDQTEGTKPVRTNDSEKSLHHRDLQDNRRDFLIFFSAFFEKVMIQNSYKHCALITLASSCR